jgi:predicted RNase H-like HicB family nuclease
MKKSDKYLKIVRWSEEDQCYIGSCPEFDFGGIHGEDEAQVYKELCLVVEEWIDIYEKDDRPLPKAKVPEKFSGKFVLRVGERLHQKLSLQAIQRGDSLNNYCKKILDTI